MIVDLAAAAAPPVAAATWWRLPIWGADVVRDSLVVLKALSWTPMHGFEITSWLEARSSGTLGVQDSALYQALHRLEEKGWIAAIGVTALIYLGVGGGAMRGSRLASQNPPKE